MSGWPEGGTPAGVLDTPAATVRDRGGGGSFSLQSSFMGWTTQHSLGRFVVSCSFLARVELRLTRCYPGCSNYRQWQSTPFAPIPCRHRMDKTAPAISRQSPKEKANSMSWRSNTAQGTSVTSAYRASAPARQSLATHPLEEVRRLGMSINPIGSVEKTRT